MAERPRVTQLPGTQSKDASVITVALGTDLDQEIWTNKTGAPVEITAVTFTPDAAHSGAATNNMTLGVVNKELLGVGTVIVAPQKAFVSGIDLVAFKPDDIPVSTTAADVRVETGEVLAFSKVENGTGLAQPAGLVTIEYRFL